MTTTSSPASKPPVGRRGVDKLLAYLRGFHPAGLAVALLFYTWSLSPSLLPRVWFLQALATGISLAIGYGLGVAGAVILHWAGVDWRPPEQWRRAGWWVLAAMALVVIPLFAVLGARWQQQIRDIIGVESDTGSVYLLVGVVAIAVALLLIQVGRGLRALAGWLSRRGRRYLPAPVARLGGVILLVVLAWVLIDGVGIRLLITGAERVYYTQDQGTREGIVRPVESGRSGSDASGEAWATLGRDGRSFVASGPRAQQIADLTGRPAVDPVRAYAGRASAETIPEVADRVVAELERTDAFDRSALAVVTTTGRGWVNTAAADSFEYLNGGDSAIAAMQYSHLQSPFAFIADRQTPLDAGTVLLEKVYERWSELPEDDRPKLVVMGESLGSYGAQGAVSSEQDMVARLDGALLIGTPRFAQPWRRLTDERDPGSPEILPVVNGGEHIRFASRSGDLDLPGEWAAPRFVYWQHASDPITWWSFDLLLRRPDWLKEPRGPDVSPEMRWLPFVTFWQVTADMALSAGVPEGYGHAYGEEAVELWAAILEPEGWDDEATERVRETIRDPDRSLQPLPEIH